MARRPGVYGPYPHGNRFRIIVFDERGASEAESFATETEANKHKAAQLRALSEETGTTVSAALDEYELYQRRKGNKPRTIDTTMHRLKSFFGELLELPVASITTAQCSRAYESLRAKVAVDTHRNTLNQARTFFRWRKVKRNPLLDVAGEGKRRKGKPQLRLDESRTWSARAIELGAAGDVRATAAATALLLGLRASEVVDRQVRDLDDGGRLLWIPDAKTEAGRRTLEVPEVLQPLLLELAKDKLPEATLFEGELVARGKKRRISRHMVLDAVQRICGEVGVPVVCAHAMRGLHSTLAIEAGATGHLVAAALGHTSFEAVTEQHYVDRERGEQAKQKRAAMKLVKEKG